MPPDQHTFNTEDSYKIAKTLLHQGTLMPMPAIVQPIMWSYADALTLVPHPDYLILADEIQEYNHELQIPTNIGRNGENLYEDEDGQVKTVHVINPGNFAINKSFVTIYPTLNKVDPCSL